MAAGATKMVRTDRMSFLVGSSNHVTLMDQSRWHFTLSIHINYDYTFFFLSRSAPPDHRHVYMNLTTFGDCYDTQFRADRPFNIQRSLLCPCLRLLP